MRATSGAASPAQFTSSAHVRLDSSVSTDLQLEAARLDYRAQQRRPIHDLAP